MDNKIYYRKLFEDGPVGIIIGTMDGKIIATNPSLHAIVGHTKGELATLEDIVNITHPDDRAADVGLFGELLGGKRDTYQIEKRYYRRDNSIVWGRLTVSTVQEAPDQPQFIYGMLEDITNYKQVEAELRSSFDKVELINKMLLGNEVELAKLKKQLSELKADIGQ